MDSVGSTTKVAIDDMLNEIGDADVYWAGCNTAWILTIQATRSLERRLLVVVTIAHLVKVGSTHQRILFADGDAGYLIRHNTYTYVRDYLLLFSPDCGT